MSEHKFSMTKKFSKEEKKQEEREKHKRMFLHLNQMRNTVSFSFTKKGDSKNGNNSKRTLFLFKKKREYLKGESKKGQKKDNQIKENLQKRDTFKKDNKKRKIKEKKYSRKRTKKENVQKHIRLETKNFCKKPREKGQTCKHKKNAKVPNKKVKSKKTKR